MWNRIIYKTDSNDNGHDYASPPDRDCYCYFNP